MYQTPSKSPEWATSVHQLGKYANLKVYGDCTRALGTHIQAGYGLIRYLQGYTHTHKLMVSYQSIHREHTILHE